MSWFDSSKLPLPEYYRSDRPNDVVCYLRSSPDPSVWRGMEATGRNQMLLLGNYEPEREDWEADAVGQMPVVDGGGVSTWYLSLAARHDNS